MRRKILLFATLLLFSLNLFAVENWNLSLGWNTSIMEGQIDEIVFSSYQGEVYTLSHLFWDVKQLWAGGPHASLSRGPWEFSLDILWNWNMGSGMMVDYDWKGYLNTDYGVGVGFDEWTDRSYHNIRIEQFLNGRLKGKWSTDIARTYGGTLSLALDYTHFYWEDSPLSYIHSSTNFRDNTGTYSVDQAITFDFTALEMQLGLMGWIRMPGETQLSLGGTFSPLSNRETVDHHLTSSPQAEYIDQFPFTFGASFEGELKKIWFSRVVTEIGFRYRWLILAQGDTILNTYPDGEYQKTINGGAGSSGTYSQWNFLVGYRF